MYKYTMCGLDNIFLANGYELHDTGYGEGVSIHDTEGLHRAIGLGIVEHCQTLGANEVRFLRKELGLTQKQLADLVGKSESTVRSWESEDRTPITISSDRLLRAFYLEFADSDLSLREIVSLINELSVDHRCELELKETEDGWQQQTAA